MTVKAEFIRQLADEFPENRLARRNDHMAFHPESAAEAALFFKLANRFQQPVVISGCDTNLDSTADDFKKLLILKTDRLNALHEIVEPDLYVTVGAGFRLSDLNPQLRNHHLFIPHGYLPYPGSAGGAVAVNLTASLNGHLLPIKKYFIKAEVVTPEGDIITPGSVCFKSVAGYDIVKIFASSWGLLGLIVKVTFRTLPLSAADEFAGMKMSAVERVNFLKGLEKSDNAADVVYSRKIKNKFDPNGILPVV